MKNICLIPARMGSSRFPNKPLINILGMPMLGHVAMRCKLEPIFDLVAVATCDQDIVDYCTSIDVRSVMTANTHERASDRVQEAAEKIEQEDNTRFQSVTMVQGDEPMVTPSMLEAALDGLRNGPAEVVNLKSKITDLEEFNSPNCVKVVTDSNGIALYFSRAPIPSAVKAKIDLPQAFKQVCIIPFTRDFLDKYSAMTPTYFEEIESVDMNRVLEQGHKLYCVETTEQSYPVDVPEDVSRVEKALQTDKYVNRYLQGRTS